MSQTRMKQMVEKEVVTSTRCDVCGKTAQGEDPDGWLHFSSSHNDWGNDSIESWEAWDVCSYACYVAKVREVFEAYDDFKGWKTLTVDGKDWEFIRSMLERVAA